MASGRTGESSPRKAEDDLIEGHLGDSLSIRARQIFLECDLLKKDYLNRSDMNLLSELLPLSKEQLEELFDTLDENKSDQLTAEELIDGFGIFLGIAANKCDSRRVRKLKMANGRPLSPIEELNDPYEDFLDQIGCHHLLKKEQHLRTLFEHLRKKNVELLPTFQDFLWRISQDFKEREIDRTALKDASQTSDSSQEDELSLKMEECLEAEKGEILSEEEFWNQKLNEIFEGELENKNKLLVEIQHQQEEMQGKILKLRFEEWTRKKENDALKKEKDCLESKLIVARKQHEDLEVQLKTINQDIWQTRQQESRGHIKWLFHEEGSQNSIDFSQEGEETPEQQTNKDGVLDRSNHLDGNPTSAHHDMQDKKFHSASKNSSWYLEKITQTDSFVESSRFLEHSNQETWKESCSFFQDGNMRSKPHWKVKLKLEPHRQKTIQCYQVNEESSPEMPVKSDICDGTLDPERIFRIILVGDSGVGKTSFIHRFCNDNFQTNFASTVGMDFRVKSILVNNECVALQFWDPAGQERFRCICKQYFRKADAAILMYNVTCEQSFMNVRQWLDSIEENAKEGIALLLIGNKADTALQNRNTVVSRLLGSKLAQEHDALFYETSVKTGMNVHKAVRELISLLQDNEDANKENFLKLEESPQKRKWRC